MAIVGLLPAAGYATRLQPLDCSKEVLPVGGRPVIDYTVERMRLAGATELVVVTREEKDDVAAYARGVGATVVLARPETVTASFAAGVRRLADDDVALLGWPDAIWEPRDGYRPLVAAVEAGLDGRGSAPDRFDGRVRRPEATSWKTVAGSSCAGDCTEGRAGGRLSS